MIISSVDSFATKTLATSTNQISNLIPLSSITNSTDIFEISTKENFNLVNPFYTETYIFTPFKFNTLSSLFNKTKLYRSKVLSYIKNKDREGFASWSKNISAKDLNKIISNLSNENREKLISILLQIEIPEKTFETYNSESVKTTKTKILKALNTILANPYVAGIYADVLSKTTIEIGGDGFYNWGAILKKVSLTPEAFAQLSDDDAVAILSHELFHRFNDEYGGAEGANTEGSAIWIYKAAFKTKLEVGESWAEAMYGTKKFYEDINWGNLTIEAPKNPSPKLIEVYNWMQTKDPSNLPWDSEELMTEYYNKYWKDLKRNVSWEEWLAQADEANKKMRYGEIICLN